jgi:hypothetical protein
MTEEQAFTLMRFQVLALGVNPQTERKLTDGYVYAWEESVYPLYDEAAPWHEPFADQFAIGRDAVNELGKFLDKRWREGSVPTFYDLEDHYDVLSGSSSWDRIRLLQVCRYMFLHRMFDDEFWNQLLAPMKHPAEASTINQPLNRQTDVYFN